MRIILASNSPHRKRVLEMLGLSFETIPSNFNEKSIRHNDPMLLAKHLSEAKARAIDSMDSIIISGDLFVVFEGHVYEKPADKEEAYSMLRAFSGKPIDIIAGVAVYNSKTKRITSGAEKCTVKFRELSDFEIRDYISRNPVTRFAAGFDMDGTIRFADSVTGYPFMTGFPVKLLIELLREQGIIV